MSLKVASSKKKKKVHAAGLNKSAPPPFPVQAVGAPLITAQPG